MKNHFIKSIFFISIIIFAGFLITNITTAQNGSGFFHLSWEADSKAPVEYSGKKLATMNSVIKASIQAFVYSGGAYLNPSNWNFKWYLNDELISEGAGVIDFRFRIENYLSDSYNVRVEIIFPNGSSSSEEIEIPIVQPKVLIWPDNGDFTIKENSLYTTSNEVILMTQAYFFSQMDNNYRAQWFIDGRYQFVERGENLFVDLSEKKERNIKVILSSSDDSLIRNMGELNVISTGGGI